MTEFRASPQPFQLNYAAIEFLYNYAVTLRSLVWVDVFNKYADDLDLIAPFGGEDPLVMLAWQSKQLEELVVNGYALDASNVVGMARLRGDTLKRFEVSHVEWSPELCEQVSEGLGRNWSPRPPPKNCFSTFYQQRQQQGIGYGNWDECVMKYVQGGSDD